ncbi:MAG: hypothetical protein HOE54_13105, partial [Gammaproteobacteria bacterium]|nr:hypothetical protein [Gammaproteobacteria bacterium]
MLAPMPMISAVAALLLLIDLAAVQVLSSMPHPDYEFTTIDGYVYIQSDDEQHRVLSLTDGTNTIQILPIDLMEE